MFLLPEREREIILPWHAWGMVGYLLADVAYGYEANPLDFSQTGYIDSSGLGVLVSLSKKIREQGGELRLANLNDDLKTLFELTKLDTLFQIADTRDRALQSF